ALASLFLVGCTRFAEQDDAPQVSLGREDADFLVAIAVDMSGSFADLMTRDGKAYEFTMRVCDNYFRQSIATKNRIVIVQLSALDRQPLLFDGTPVQLRQSFPSATEFRDFLLKK